ncbi:hypothetical protein [Jannaschia formosa]|uniref:hypothetical protein n=1 Tax=Jannaschia formosa TaxID=2259592 RepID=UPI001075466B|nr:hypothetical protein [Jannaschia formosa]TFL15967.1 hypothetical protein DR046_22580 [Jannaschia formosa]
MTDPAHRDDPNSNLPPRGDIAAAVAEAGRQRAALARSLTALRGEAKRLLSSISPSAVEGRARSAVAHAGDELREGTMRRVRRHPVGAALVAAGLAKPLVGLFGKLSPTVGLTGAGLALLLRGDKDANGKSRSPGNAAHPDREAGTSRAAPERGLPVPPNRPLPTPPPTSGPPPRVRPRPSVERVKSRSRRSPARETNPIGQAARTARAHPVATGLLGIAVALTLAATSSPKVRTRARRTGREIGRETARAAHAARNAVTRSERSASTNARARPGERSKPASGGGSGKTRPPTASAPRASGGTVGSGKVSQTPSLSGDGADRASSPPAKGGDDKSEDTVSRAPGRTGRNDEQDGR